MEEDAGKAAGSLKADASIAHIAHIAPNPEASEQIRGGQPVPERGDGPGWRGWIERRTETRWRAYGDRADALACLEAIAVWHTHHGERLPHSVCAGCGEAMYGRRLDFPMAAVHFETLDCLIAYGRRWRAEARAALADIGVVVADSSNMW
ncbi:MAG: hypothetical protein CMM50_01210 [Rhodospirillaceae bacterium]|nr:hypothetical protein [Rhodospirillaceae bacterium]